MARKTSKNAAKRSAHKLATTGNSGEKPLPKSAQIVSLLRRQNGASLPELMKATGWQAHSVRGFISGTLKRKRGLVISSATEEGKDRRYLISSAV